MGVNRGAAGEAFTAIILSVDTTCRTNKIRDKILRKCLKHPGIGALAAALYM